MRDVDIQYDALVIGAGPAGLCFALRLQQLGHRVLLVERSTCWPRPQVGEALTPGVRNIIDLLDANDALTNVPHVANATGRVLWRSLTPESIAGSDSAIVDRSSFDFALLTLAKCRGVEVDRPASVLNITGAGGDWLVSLLSADAHRREVRVRYILDSTGRNSRGGVQLAPRLAALWAEVDAAAVKNFGRATQVEALENGWLWAGCLPGERYRIMFVCDPQTMRQDMPASPERCLRAACGTSKLLHSTADLNYRDKVQVCSATPYFAADCWQYGRMKLGDAAFALDPISSSGVEKAMRFSLQAAVATHTLLCDSSDANQDLARRFFEGRLIEACARHAHWTEGYYSQSWCADKPFWHVRSRHSAIDENVIGYGLMVAIFNERSRLARYLSPEIKPLSSLDTVRPLRLHRDASVIDLPCVVENRLSLHAAIDHPNLVRPIAFLEDEALFPHLARLWQPMLLAQLLQMLTASMPIIKAQRITAWLWQHGLLESIDN
jgi:2-polyprenyl-6-methoxyphenol hydroxylase-like FAD-dependent oxidoreductase